MYYIIAAVLAFTLSAGVTFAQNNGAKGEPKYQKVEKKNNTDPMQGRDKRRQARQYSITFNRVVNRSLKLDLNETQKEELKSINKEYLASIVEKEKELQGSQRALMKSLTNSGFKDEEVTKEFEKTQALRAELFGQYVKGLNEVKAVVGDENYDTLFQRGKGKKGKKGSTTKEMKSEKESSEASEKKDEKSE